MLATIALTLLLTVSLAQRLLNDIICDYYTFQLYGTNLIVNQFYLVQELVTLALVGGSSLSNANSNLTGILNPGTYQGTRVDLRGYFDASLLSSNILSEPAAINWLDGGGIQPLVNFLTGGVSNVTIASTTNQ